MTIMNKFLLFIALDRNLEILRNFAQISISEIRRVLLTMVLMRETNYRGQYYREQSTKSDGFAIMIYKT